MNLAYRTLPSLNEISRALNSVQSNSAEGGWRPALEIRRTAEGYLLSLDLPGVKADAIDIAVEDDTLTVSGERSSPVAKDEADHAVLRSERLSGRFERSFQLNDEIDSERIDASMADGVLSLTLQRKPTVEPRRIEVSIGE